MPLTAWAWTEYLVLEDGSRVEQFALSQQAHETVNGPQELAPRRYRLRDYFNDRDLGEVASPGAVMQLAFERVLVLEAIPA